VVSRWIRGIAATDSPRSNDRYSILTNLLHTYLMRDLVMFSIEVTLGIILRILQVVGMTMLVEASWSPY
jgi:hypothetical protein